MDITNTHDTDGAFAMMVKNILPAGIKGIVTIGFICALVASLAAFFNSCATLFTEDLLVRLFLQRTSVPSILLVWLAQELKTV